MDLCSTPSAASRLDNTELIHAVKPRFQVLSSNHIHVILSVVSDLVMNCPLVKPSEHKLGNFSSFPTLATMLLMSELQPYRDCDDVSSMTNLQTQSASRITCIRKN